MQTLKKTIFILIAVISSISGYAYGEDSVKVKKQPIATDTLVSDAEEELSDFNDSTLFIPSYATYSNWDTVDIHPYHFDMAKSADTINIHLNDIMYCGYYHPFSGRVTSNFGYRKSRFHYGIDIDLETGDSVRCAFEGKVRIAKRNKSYGNVVIVRHNNGLETIYAHLSKILVKSGDFVDAGKLLGLGGNTGKSRGSHLHFETRYKGQPINPNDIISFETDKLICDSIVITKKNFEYQKKIKNARYHTVRKGDTLYSISRKYGTTIKTICKLNGIKTTTVLRAGKKLRYA